MKYIAFLSYTLMATVQAFLPIRPTTTSTHQALRATKESSSSSSSSSKDDHAPPERSDNPCWEDLYDDDCAMSNVFSASFVAADWIKSMPCGQGIEDCDMAEDLRVPETRPEAGIDHVDVMGMLGLKRAKSVNGE